MVSTSVPTTEVNVPDIGDFHDVPIVEVLVKPGDRVNADDPLITLESDKASMEVPSPTAGTVRAVHVQVGDRVSQGRLIVSLETHAEGATTPPPSLVEQQEPAPTSQTPPTPAPGSPAAVKSGAAASGGDGQVHASPSVRRLTRELDVISARSAAAVRRVV